ncbi:hypothetical protein JRO89_XS05G0230800 [Xanthoceras sorbifolium]|uniref:Retrotransposon Copia-like N-terminal domain-containing protein n=1 Tax=Xanthoceras sorbifolium TaxID=99658 RepID=A0ABQ8I2V2_9ROSI|nr:hypothetical protein JRO89_XS05G0230800 [Xanthoceras sorbifolium]
MAGNDEQPPSPPPKREMNSPFFLGTGDRPGDFITPTRLRGDNYDDWASDIQLALEARRKFEFLEGTITEPQPPYTQSDWNTVNAMLVSWITNTIDPEVKSTLSKFRDAKRLWEHLKQRYAMHEPLISCNCCSSCTAASLHQARREQGKLHDFLMGLNTDLYAQLRTNILSQDPLPSLDRAYQLVIQDERVRLAKAVTDDKPAEVLGFAIRTGAGRGRGNTERPVCSHCKKTGHESSTCWSLVACPHCHKHGHDKNNCYEIVGYPEGWSNQNKADGGAGRSRQQASRGRGSARANAATSLIGNAQVPDDRLNGKFDTKSWIIDTGATHHDHTRELIGTGVRRDGLYYFGGAEGDSVQHVSVHNTASTLELWHKMMGHPSEKVVKLLPPVSNLKDQAPHFDADLDLGLREGGQAHTEASSAPQTEASSAPLSPRPEVFPTAGPHSPGLDNTSNRQSAPMGKGMRDKFPSVLLRDFVTHTVVAESPSPATPSPQHPSEDWKRIMVIRDYDLCLQEDEVTTRVYNVVATPSVLQRVKQSQWQDEELRTLWNRLINGEHLEGWEIKADGFIYYKGKVVVANDPELRRDVLV